MKRKSIAVIGGGTGTFTVLSGLKNYPVELSAIVAMADNGGSTRILREEFGILPPGSVRPALVALSGAEKSLADLFNYRFSNGNGLSGHNFGNLFLTALTNQLGSFQKALKETAKILRLRGEVLPSTLQDVQLYAQLENGDVIEGEANIDVPTHNGELRIEKVWLKPKCKANPEALKALAKANLIVIAPGDIFSSILPNFLPAGMKQAFQKSRAKKVYVCNLMTKYGETNGFQVHDFVDTIEAYAGKDSLDYVLVNGKKPSLSRIQKYEEKRSEVIIYDPAALRKRKIRVVQKPLLRKRGFIRHDSDLLAEAILSL
ncbi:MAG: YvcK family protein [Candidatus Yanofskybacteria bacterium]|nr:YvcK family protein [Candidatus Yanofskybacteria bacterium]